MMHYDKAVRIVGRWMSVTGADDLASIPNGTTIYVRLGLVDHFAELAKKKGKKFIIWPNIFMAAHLVLTDVVAAEGE